jgi:DNA-binding NarL/FixJ family response regulator
MDTIPCIDDNRGMSSVRVLVVEDNEPYRRFICSTFKKRPELHIVCEVSDGLEAVQKAKELHPDLVVLDIGLPSLNGIQVARRIRKLSPESKILFVSQESDADVVQEALGLGAVGYVAKTNAGIELLAAVEAVSQGRRFVSGRLAGHVPAELADRQVPKRLHSDEVVALPPEAGDD